MRIYLTGFMCSGKTTIGRLLAEKRNVPFVDLDQELEHSHSKTIVELFETKGEAYFRDQESRMLKRLEDHSCVIATGGGCFIQNREWMLRNGTVVYLDVPFDEIVRRIGGDPARPLWKNAEKLYMERSDEYRKAHFIVDASGNPEDVVERITTLPLPE